jgi:hypothetical protein
METGANCPFQAGHGAFAGFEPLPACYSAGSGAGRCMSHNTAEVTMRYVVDIGEEFACPYCGARYTLELEDGTPVLGMLGGERLCAHLDREVLPASTGDVWEVYFAEPEPERD